MQKMEELQLTRQCRAGDQRAWRMLYDRYAGRMLAVALRYLGDRARGEDLMQEAFIRIFNRFDRFEWQGEGSLWGWIKQITIRLAIDQLRQEGRLETLRIDEERLELFHTEVDMEQLQAFSTDELLELIARMPDGYRTILNLYCIDGFSHRQIAEQLHILEKSSSSRLSRARALLAKRMREHKTR